MLKSLAIPWSKEVPFVSHVIGKSIYPTRLSSRKQYLNKFGREYIDEFKGYNINSSQKMEYPIQNYLYHLSLYPANNSIIKNKFESDLISKNINPFVALNQKIINGKMFFEYIKTYTEIYKLIFSNDNLDIEPLKDFKKFYKTYLLKYNGSNRKGDEYLRLIYEALIILLLDKFGEASVLKFYKILYRIIYSHRIASRNIDYRSLNNFLDEIKIFYYIEFFYQLDEIDEKLNYILKLRINNKDIQNRHINKNIVKLEPIIIKMIMEGKDG